MIQANELRIGNYVYDDFDEIHLVESIQSNRLIEYNRSGDPNVIISKLDGSNGFYVSDSISPIPLTEEILLKCGFHEIYKSDYSIRHELLDNPKIEYKWNNTFGWNLYVQGWCIDGIKYLHQLQNAIYFLVGHELEVKL